jgi:ribonuclease VapC
MSKAILMVIDSSAIVAIALEEPSYDLLVRKIANADEPTMSAVSHFETRMVVFAKRGAVALQKLDRFLASSAIRIAICDETQSGLALDAFRQFGKGRHPAQLNFGDCFSYALAKSLDEPLLFKGDDFSVTDITSA